jgi:hypothetical protein
MDSGTVMVTVPMVIMRDIIGVVDKKKLSSALPSLMFRRQRMNHFTVATTAIAIAIPSVRLAARWNHRRRSAKRSDLKTAGAK